MTNIISFPSRSRPLPPAHRPTFGEIARAIIAMEAAGASLDAHADKIGGLARHFTDLINIGRPDPKVIATANLFISAHMFIEDLKAWQAANRPAEVKQ